MKKKIISIISLTLFVGIVAFNAKINTVNNQNSNMSLSKIEALTASAEEVVRCIAEADCDSVGGSGNVTCNGYDPQYSCYSYPLLGRVKCDNKYHYCMVI